MYPRGTFFDIRSQQFEDIIQAAQLSTSWTLLENKIVSGFEGDKFSTLELMGKVVQSEVLPMDMKERFFKKLTDSFCQQITSIKTTSSQDTNKLQKQLWPILLAIEGTESFVDLARTYIAYFPRGGYEKADGEQRFEDLLRLAASAAIWDIISPTVLKTFKNDMEGALVFVQLCKKRSLHRSVWLPFLSIALRLGEERALAHASALSKETVPRYYASSALLESMRNTAMMLDHQSDSDAVAKLLNQHIVMSGGVVKFSHLVTVVRRFPDVWEASKAHVVCAMSKRLETALSFIEECRAEKLPETVWGPSVDICVQNVVPPKDEELNDTGFQQRLWRVAIDVPVPDLCQTSVVRYMAAPLKSTVIAATALAFACKEDSRGFEDKDTILEPLLRHWLQSTEDLEIRAVEKQLKQVEIWNRTGASITGHPSLAEFANSSKESMTIYGFDSYSKAKKCAAGIVFKNCKGTAQALEHDDDEDWYVEVKKEVHYAQRLEDKQKGLKARCDIFQELLVQVSGDRPAKKRKVR